MSPSSPRPLGRRVRDTVFAPAGRRIAAIATALVASAALVSSCFVGTQGLDPPLSILYFPTSLTISPGRSTLYVSNSDFDLQYNGGTMMALDLASETGLRTRARNMALALESNGADLTVPGSEAIESACRSQGLTTNDAIFAHPGPCIPTYLQFFVKKFATIGAFASQAVLAHRNDGQAGLRLFLTVRGDPSVTYFDVVDDRDPANPVSPCGEAFCLSCGGSGVANRCGASHRIGTDPFDNQRGLKMPTEPTGIDIAELGTSGADPIVVAHQATGQASLVLNRWPGTNAAGPTLEFSLGNLPLGPVGVVHIPPPAVVKASNGIIQYQPGFVVSYLSSPALTIVRYVDDATASPERPFLKPTDSIPITISGQGNDSRSMAFDTTKRDQCEANCGGELECLTGCLIHPIPFFVVSRAPASVMVGKITTTPNPPLGQITSVDEVLTLQEIIPLDQGTSGISLGHIVDQNGDLQLRLFVVAFDTRSIFMLDPENPNIPPEVIRTGRGPFGMAFDTTPGDSGAGNAESYMYVGNFTDSYIGVVDLDKRRKTFLNVLLNVGPPKPPIGDSGQFQ